MCSPPSEVSVKSGAGSPSSTGKRASVRRAVGVVRVSRVGDRDGDRFVSPREQVERIQRSRSATAEARRHDRGARRLRRRPAREAPRPASRRGARRGRRCRRRRRRVLRQARSVARGAGRGRGTGRESRRRDPRGRRGGGPRRHAPSRWLSSTMLGLVAEYHRRSTSERTADAKRRAVMRGVPPFPNVPPGYRSGRTGRSSRTGTLTRSRRRSGCGRTAPTVMEVREHLRDAGLDRSFHGTQALLPSRIASASSASARS